MMPKLQNITEAEIKAALDGGDDLLADLHDFINKLEKGYCDTLEAPARLARTLSNFAAASSKLAVLVLAKAEMQEQKQELEALLKERAKLKD